MNTALNIMALLRDRLGQYFTKELLKKPESISTEIIEKHTAKILS
jgi:hypothetical protein